MEGDITTPRSNSIGAHTDIDKPGSPLITNLTCMNTGSLYVEWLRPDKYGSHVDTYKLYYGPSSYRSDQFQVITVKPDADDVKSEVFKQLKFQRVMVQINSKIPM